MTARHALLLHFDHSPRAIVAAIGNLRTRRAQTQSALKGSGKGVVQLIAAGGAIYVLDRIFGYESHLYSLVGIGIIVVGLWAGWRRIRAGQQPTYDDPDLFVAERVIHTLRDDVAPQRNMHGTVDLRGATQDEKRVRTKEDARGRTISYYRDDWLTIKTKLYDGSMLRFAVVKRFKVRDGYYKRGRVSGKMKFKPPVVKSEASKIDVRVSANPQLYSLSSEAAPRVGERVGGCTVDGVTLDDGLLRVTASLAETPTAQDVLDLLSATYRTLQRKVAA